MTTKQELAMHSVQVALEYAMSTLKPDGKDDPEYFGAYLTEIVEGALNAAIRDKDKHKNLTLTIRINR